MNYKVYNFCLIFLNVFAVVSAQEYQSGKYFTNNKNVLINGYDVVSYFVNENPYKGKSSISTNYDGVVLYFSSLENKNRFTENPEKYLPKYGGFCAFGVGMESIGYKAGRYKIDPKIYKIINKRLYLFYPTKEWPAIDYWNENEVFFMKEANKKWREIKYQ